MTVTGRATIYVGDVNVVLGPAPASCDPRWTLSRGLVVPRLALLGPFDGVLCDPPYHLTGKSGTSGFMGKAWDGGDVAFRPETWAAVMAHLRPGAYLLACGGSRTFHWLAVAIERAGFEYEDTVLWLYGSGFPKSRNVSKDLDNMVGAEPAAIQWDGYGTALKPAFEPVVLARVPRDGTIANNALTHGTGAMDIDGCRTPGVNKSVVGPVTRRGSVAGDTRSAASAGAFGVGASFVPENHPERWPANILHDGSKEVLAGFPQTTSVGHHPASRGRGGVSTSGHAGQRDLAERHDSTSGSAARFFYTAKASRAEREAGCESLPEQQQDESREEDAPGANNPRNRGGKTRKNHHPTVKPLALCRYLARLILPPPRTDGRPRRLLVPFSGSGSEMIGALMAGWDEVVGIELMPEYADIAHARIAFWTGAKAPGIDDVDADPDATDAPVGLSQLSLI